MSSYLTTQFFLVFLLPRIFFRIQAEKLGKISSRLLGRSYHYCDDDFGGLFIPFQVKKIQLCWRNRFGKMVMKGVILAAPKKKFTGE
jgi:hypothetical protein